MLLVPMTTLALALGASAQEKAPEAKPVQPVQISPPAFQPPPGQPGAVPPAPAKVMPEALKIEQSNFSWGDISDQSPVDHTFQFTNISDRTIKMTVTASCGCTVTKLEKDTYVPGENGTVTATFNPQGRQGLQEKILTATIIDPQGVFVQQQMKLSAMVKALVTVDPPKVYLADVDHRQGQTTKLTVTGRLDGFKIEKVEPSSEFVKATLGEARVTEENGEKITKIDVEIEMGKGAPIGGLQSQLTFVTNDARAKNTTVFIGGDVVGEVRSTPPQAVIRANRTSTNFTTQVRVDSRSGTPFNIASIDVEGRQDMQMVTDAVRNDDGRFYMITLAGVTPADAGMVQGAIVIITDAEGGETIRIPFNAFVQKVGAAGAPVFPNTASVSPTAATAAPAAPPSPGH